MTDPSRDPQQPTPFGPPEPPHVEYVVSTGEQGAPQLPWPPRYPAPSPTQYPAPWPPAAQAPAKQPKTALLIALIAAVAVAITAVVIVAASGNGFKKNVAGAPSAKGSASAAGGPAAAAKSELDEGQITATLIAIGAQTKGALLQNLTFNPDGSSRFGVCADDDTIEYYAVQKHGETTPDGTEELGCFAGFKTSDLSASTLADLAAKNSAETAVGLMVESWGTYTPTITILIDDEWDLEYDLDGNELDIGLDGNQTADRKKAIAELEKASGITEVATICVDLETGIVMLTGDAKNIETWQYTNLPQRVETWPTSSTGRLHTKDYDMQAQLDSAAKVSDKYDSDGSYLATVCLDATYEPGTVRAFYFYSKSLDAIEYSHTIIADLEGNILEEL